jgi:hypothetical protein
LEAGDRLELSMTGPDGAVLAQSASDPLASDKAQHIVYVGKKLRAAAWAPGTYSAAYRVRRGDKVVVERTFTTRL